MRFSLFLFFLQGLEINSAKRLKQVTGNGFKLQLGYRVTGP